MDEGFGTTKIGSKEGTIKNYVLIIDGKECEGNPGLWELIGSIKPDPEKFTREDYNTDREILQPTNAMHRNRDPNHPHPKANRGDK